MTGIDFNVQSPSSPTKSTPENVCSVNNVKHDGPVYRNKTLLGGMKAGNFSYLGKAKQVLNQNYCRKECVVCVTEQNFDFLFQFIVVGMFFYAFQVQRLTGDQSTKISFFFLYLYACGVEIPEILGLLCVSKIRAVHTKHKLAKKIESQCC